MSHRVRIGTCSGPTDAALVRSLFSAHGIAVVIGAEHHASLFGPLGASFLSLDIWVDEEDSEQAVALLRDLRERRERGDGDGDDEEAEAAAQDAEAAAAAEFEESTGDSTDGVDDPQDDPQDDPGSSVQLRIDRRRRTGLVLLLGCCITFGTAHMFTRAWMRGITLAAIEFVGIRQASRGHTLGGVVIVAAILVDVIGALWRVRTAAPPDFPRARIHNA